MPHFQKDPHNFVCRQNQFLFQERNFSQKQCFWYIKLPIIKSSLLICGILTIYNSFRCFREAYLIGGSHPNEQLYSIQHFLQNNFMNMNYARLEAASILVVIFVEAFVLSGMCLARKKRNN